MTSLTEDVCSICSEILCLSKKMLANEDLLKKLALLVEINTTAPQNIQICETCSENIQEASNFKTHLKNAHKEHITTEKIEVNSEIFCTCHMCRNTSKKSASSPLFEFTREFKYVTNYLPEGLALEMTNDTYICCSCQKSMLHLQSIMDLLSIYKENTLNINSIKVGNLNNENKIEVKQEFCTEFSERIYTSSTEINEIIQNADINDIQENLKDETFLYEDFTCKNEEIDLKMESNETLVTDEMRKYIDDTVKNPPNLSGHFNIYITYNCDLCEYTTNKQENIKRHKIVHKDLSEIKMYKCTVCDYETKLRSNLKIHMITHKSIDEIELFKCEHCNLKTKYKSKLKQHMLIHRNIDELQTFKCNYCDYRTIHKSGFKRHQIVHKNITEVETFKCEVCGYLTKHKSYLKHHLLTHQNISEIKAFTCDVCGYKARHRSNLKTHTLMHKNISEIKMLKCEFCDFQTKYKSSFRMHKVIHKSENDIKMYPCEVCEYKTKRKENLKSHMLKHQKGNELVLFKCNVCKFKTKHKQYLKKHALIHKDINEIERFECNICDYKARQKGNLKVHLMLHKKRLKR